MRTRPIVGSTTASRTTASFGQTVVAEYLLLELHPGEGITKEEVLQAFSTFVFRPQLRGVAACEGRTAPVDQTRAIRTFTVRIWAQPDGNEILEAHVHYLDRRSSMLARKA